MFSVRRTIIFHMNAIKNDKSDKKDIFLKTHMTQVQTMYGLIIKRDLQQKYLDKK